MKPKACVRPRPPVPVLPVFLALLVGPFVGASAAQDELHLALGDPARRDRQVPVVLDGVVDSTTGEVITPQELPEHLAGVRLLLLGESHTEMEFHRVQRRVLETLAAAGRKVLVGLEMYPVTEQGRLDQWNRGLLTEEGFLELSRWYASWGYNWGYYRDIFVSARQRGIPLFAVNVPREVVTAVRKHGFEGLDPAQKALLPPRIDTESAEHRALFRAFFGGDDTLHAHLSPEQWEGMYRAQATWDAAMAWSSIRVLREHPEPGAILIVLVGQGHVAYRLGIARQVLALAGDELAGKLATLIPVPVRDESGEPVADVQASYADFVWGVPAEAEPLYPALGLSTAAGEGEGGRRVIYVAAGSVAERSGFEIGDVLLTVDGTAIDGREVLNRAVGGKRWGDRALFTVRRGEETLEVPVFFRRVGKGCPPPRNPTEAGSPPPASPGGRMSPEGGGPR